MSTHRAALAFTGIGLLLLLGVSMHDRIAGAQPIPTVVRAQAFELVDGGGQIRGRLNVESDGQVVFRLLDARGTIRVKLGASEDGSGLVLLNEETEPGVHVLATQGATSLALQRGTQRRVITP